MPVARLHGLSHIVPFVSPGLTYTLGDPSKPPSDPNRAVSKPRPPARKKNAAEAIISVWKSVKKLLLLLPDSNSNYKKVVPPACCFHVPLVMIVFRHVHLSVPTLFYLPGNLQSWQSFKCGLAHTPALGARYKRHRESARRHCERHTVGSSLRRLEHLGLHTLQGKVVGGRN